MAKKKEKLSAIPRRSKDRGQGSGARGQEKPERPEFPKLRLEYLDPADLEANPSNWRTHPAEQMQSLEAVIAEVGWAGALLVNERGGKRRLVDGHARKELFAGRGPVPVLVGSWTDEQEKLILASLDPLAAMAEASKPELEKLMKEVGELYKAPAIKQMFDSLAAANETAAAKHTGHTNGDDVEAKDRVAEPITIDVVRCARCGKNHDPLEFAPLTIPTVDGWTHWVPCPNNGEPILLSMKRSPSQK
jgi:hypothetical protein